MDQNRYGVVAETADAGKRLPLPSPSRGPDSVSPARAKDAELNALPIRSAPQQRSAHSPLGLQARVRKCTIRR